VDAMLGEDYNKYGWILDDNHVVIDIDVHAEKANGYESLKKLESQIGFSLLDACGAVVESPSGGRHYYFSKPANAKFGKVFAAEYPGIDFISGKGKQVIAAGSCHDSFPGTLYEINENPELVQIPFALLEHLKSLRTQTAQNQVPSYSDNEGDRSGDEFNQSERGLTLLIGELAGRGYEVRRKENYYEFDRPGKTTGSKCSGHVGKKSKQGNYQLTCFTLSDLCFPTGEAMTIFNAYALLCFNGNHKEAAVALYDRGFAQIDQGGVDLTQLAQIRASVQQSLESTEPEEYDNDEAFAECMIPKSGLMRLAFQHYENTSHRMSYTMGLAVAVSLCQVIFGRKIASQTDMRTNDYNVIIAPTNCGKEAVEKALTQIILSADPNSLSIIPPDVQSGNGLLSALANAKAAIWIGDEFGKVLGEILDSKQKGSFRRDIGTHLLKLYGKADSVYGGAAHSAGVRNRIIQPHLCVLGLTTGSTLFEAVDAKNISDGLFGRIAFWPVQNRPKRRRMRKAEPNQNLVELVRSWLEFQPSGHLGNEYPHPRVVEMSNHAEAMWDKYNDEIDERMDEEKETRAAIWGRVAGRAMKLALVHRLSRETANPNALIWDIIEVEEQDVEWAIKLSNWLANIACDLISQNFFDKTEASAKTTLLEYLRAAGGSATKRDIERSNRSLTGGDIADAAKQLERAGLVSIVQVKTKGRPKITYQLVSE
jgi:hypothetical protein